MRAKLERDKSFLYNIRTNTRAYRSFAITLGPFGHGTIFMDWHETLTDIFGGYVNQQTLEEGANQMVFVSSDNPVYHARFMNAIDAGIAATAANDSSVTQIVNTSGYRVSRAVEASSLLRELRRLYLERFERTVS